MTPLSFVTRAMALSLVWGIILSSCSEEKKSYVANIEDASKTPTMTTSDVSTFISDSGYTRYHITADRWDIFDDSIRPMWVFPTGLQLENYDLRMRPAATLVCDSATYYSNSRLWRLDGNVVMVNVQKDTFLTQQLFWDQRRAEVYSDSFIHIVRREHIIEGYGFTSDQTMSAYSVIRPTAIIPMKRDGSGRSTLSPTTLEDTLQTDYSTRPSAPEPASVRNTRAREYLGNSNSSSTSKNSTGSDIPTTKLNRRGSVTHSRRMSDRP